MARDQAFEMSGSAEARVSMMHSTTNISVTAWTAASLSTSH